jgi:hypothetical protein
LRETETAYSALQFCHISLLTLICNGITSIFEKFRDDKIRGVECRSGEAEDDGWMDGLVFLVQCNETSDSETACALVQFSA